MPLWVLWVALPVTMIVTWLARHHALRHDLLDQPGERRSHTRVTPRGGGVGIAVVTGLGILSFDVWPMIVRGLVVFGLLLVSGIGWLDDHRPVSARWRLLVQLVAGASLAWALHATGQAGSWLALIAVPILVNVWNFMDGIDGIAASQAALVACAFAFGWPEASTLPLAWLLLLACVGFLPFNFLPRWKVFLGDAGSYALGYLLAMLALSVPVHGAAPALVLLPMSAFLLDATLTLLTRISKGEPWWRPHRQHVYQRLVQHGWSHRSVTLLYAGWTVVCALAMIPLVDASALAQGVSTLVVFAVGAIVWWWAGARLRASQGSALE